MNYYYKQIFSFNQIDRFSKDNAIIDGRKGGLVIGPSHVNKGVYFLFEYKDGFRLYGEVEGFEYIINRASSEKNRALLRDINNLERDFSADFAEYQYDKGILTIDATSPNESLYNSKIVILDVLGGFAIINKHSTKKFLAKIDDLNKQ